MADRGVFRHLAAIPKEKFGPTDREAPPKPAKRSQENVFNGWGTVATSANTKSPVARNQSLAILSPLGFFWASEGAMRISAQLLSIVLAAAGVSLLTGCDPFKHLQPDERQYALDIMKCGTNWVSGVDADIDLEADVAEIFKKEGATLKAKARAVRLVGTEYLEYFPEDQRVEAINSYHSCINGQPPGRISPGFQDLYTTSENYAKEWAAVYDDNTVEPDLLLVTDHVMVASALKEFAEDEANSLRERIVAANRAAAMYGIAAEIIDRQKGDVRSNWLGKARTFAAESANLAAMAHRDLTAWDGANAADREWVLERKPLEGILWRHAFALAQQVALGDDGAKIEMNKVLSDLDCSTITKYRLPSEEYFQRAGAASSFSRCQ